MSLVRHAIRWFAAPLLLLVWLAGLPSDPVAPRIAGAEVPDGSPVSSVSLVGNQLTFTALPDESTQVDFALLTDAPTRYLLTSSEPVFASSGCTAVTQFSAYCTVTVGVSVTLNLSDGLSDGIDTAHIRGSRTNDTIGVFTGLADDVVIVDADGAATGPVTMIGGAGSFDELWLDDTQSPGGRNYAVVADAMTRTGSGAYSHTGVETVRLFAAGGSDTVLVNATAATTTSLISTGAGVDTIQIGATTLDPLDGPIFLDGEANSDFLTLKDTTIGANNVFTVGATQIVRAGFAGVTHEDVESIWVDGGSGHEQWNVTGTSAATYLNGGDGIDTFTVANNLDALAAPLTVDGQGHVDQLDIDDRGNLTPAEYTVTGTNVYRQIGPPVTSIAYASVDGVTLNTQDAASTIWIAGTSANMHVFGHGGDDLIKIGDGTVNNLAHTVNVFGGAGADDILIDDTTAPQGGGSYSVTGNSFDRVNGNFGLLQYEDVESFTLDAQQLGNEIGVTSTAEDVDYVLNGGDGPDLIGIGFNLDLHLGNLLVRGNGGADTFTVDDTAVTTGNTYELRAGRIERVAQVARSPILYQTVEHVKLITGAGPETVALLGTVPGTTTTIETGDQTDQVAVVALGLAATGLAELRGGPSMDLLYFHNGGLASVNNGTTITTPGRHQVNYAEFETAQVVSSGTDIDGDGCADTAEIGLDRNFGGERSPFNFYDWFDVAGPGDSPPDKAIDLSDTLAVLARFGLQQGDPGYSSTYDREAFYPSMPWRPFPANGVNLGIDLQDALISLQSFGHSCL